MQNTKHANRAALDEQIREIAERHFPECCDGHKHDIEIIFDDNRTIVRAAGKQASFKNKGVAWAVAGLLSKKQIIGRG
jgi:spermidine synthase